MATQAQQVGLDSNGEIEITILSDRQLDEKEAESRGIWDHILKQVLGEDVSFAWNEDPDQALILYFDDL